MSTQDDLLIRLTALLHSREMSWAEFARRLGTTSQRVYNWRKRGIPGAEIIRIAALMDVSVEWLVYGRDVAERPAADPDTASTGDGGNPISTAAISREEAEFLGRFRVLTADERAALFTIANAMTRERRRQGRTKDRAKHA